GILLHPRVEILTHPAHAIFDLEAISVDLPQPLEDRFEPPAPPAPRIGEMDDLHVGRGLSRHQETSQRAISAGDLEADRCPRVASSSGAKRVLRRLRTLGYSRWWTRGRKRLDAARPFSPRARSPNRRGNGRSGNSR